jgi:L,D-transpeptidase catalytic domain
LSNNGAQDESAASQRLTGGRLPASALSLALLVALGVAPAAARGQHKPERKETAHASKEPFGTIPKGPVQIFVSINQQKLHLYSDGMHVADTSVATGVPQLPTPLGVFSVIQKQVFHRSNIYSNAPMPFMQRITWSGVALHEGESIGHRASHGCIRMPHDFAVRLYDLTRLGARVIVADPELKPTDFADSHLFVHKDKPPAEAAAPASSPAAAVPPTKTAATVDASKTIDALPADPTAPSQPAALGLRMSNELVVASDSKAVPSSDPKTVGAVPAAAASDASVPMPLNKPADLGNGAPVKKMPIAIFISRKTKKIYVRQDFAPLFDAAVTIDNPDQPFGTHVFTALNFEDDHSTLRWNVVSLPGEPAKLAPGKTERKVERRDERDERYVRGRRHREEAREKGPAYPPPPQTPQQALARIGIPQNAIDYISQLIVPGSSLIISDQGLGDETGEGTDFIVVARDH